MSALTTERKEAILKATNGKYLEFFFNSELTEKLTKEAILEMSNFGQILKVETTLKNKILYISIQTDNYNLAVSYILDVCTYVQIFRNLSMDSNNIQSCIKNTSCYIKDLFSRI